MFYLIYLHAILVFDYQLGVNMDGHVRVRRNHHRGRHRVLVRIRVRRSRYLHTTAFCRSCRTLARAVPGAAVGVAVYWPVVVLASTIAARDTPGWNLANETAFWIVLSIVSLWALLDFGELHFDDRFRQTCFCVNIILMHHYCVPDSQKTVIQQFSSIFLIKVHNRQQQRGKVMSLDLALSQPLF
jgi:hypothetical protein